MNSSAGFGSIANFFGNFLKALTWPDYSLQNKEEEISSKRDENSDYSDF